MKPQQYKLRPLVAAILAGAVSAPFAALAEELPVIQVEAEAETLDNEYVQKSEDVPPTSPNSADLLRKAPGGNVNKNGPLSGIAQYRGMYGDRVNVQIDGMAINSGGPNAMDAPLSYIPRVQLDTLVVERGISSVSAGSESIGGTVRAESKTSHFTDSDAFSFQTDVEPVYTSVNAGTAMGALLGFANRNHRVHFLGSHEEGDDTEYPNGEIFPTEYERDNYGVGYGYRNGGDEFQINVKRNETGNAGTPALPMDIAYIDSDLFNTDYWHAFGEMTLHLALSRTEVDHLMTNYHLRTPPPTPMMYRQANTGSEGTGFKADLSRPVFGGEIRFGLDGHLADHDAEITNPNNAMFFIDSYNGVQRDQLGAFTEWAGAVSGPWRAEFGLRFNRVSMDANEVSFTGLMDMMGMAAANLRDDFNAADRSVVDNNVDWVAKLTRPLNAEATLIAEVGRKTRSPSYQERYLWLPLESTGGLADGRSYVGDINLNPEVAHEVGLGVDWNNGRGYFTPRAFYRKVSDYIQGTPSTNPDANMVATMMGGQPALQFTNVDALFYGIDAAYGLRIDSHWRLDGIVNYVRGKRDDIDDNLYRIAPLNATAAVTYEASVWSVTAEGVFYAEQDEVAQYNGEQQTGAYSLLNLYARYRIKKDTYVNFGVENVLDEDYQDHLAGYNRVMGSDVPAGERVPGPGRGVYAGLRLML